MADGSPPRQLLGRHYQEGAVKPRLAGQGPSASTVLAVVTLVPVAGTLLGLSGLALAGTLFGLAVATPLFIIFSPVVVPAAIGIFLAVTAILTSGVFGLTGLTSLSWVYRYLRLASRKMPEQIDQAKRRMQDMAGSMGQKTKDVGQEVQGKAHEAGRRA